MEITEETDVPETLVQKTHKKPTIISEIWPEKKEKEAEKEIVTENKKEKKIDVIRVNRKKRDDDIQAIFGGQGNTKALPAGRTTLDETREPQVSHGDSPEITDSLKNMAEIMKSFSNKKY